MAVNVKMGVDLSGFKSGIQQGTQILKGLNSEMKAAEAEFKATGNAEQLMANKTKTLNSQIQVQKGIVDQAKTALQQMTDAGVDPADKAYQSMYATMMKAQAGMYEAQAALNGLNTSAQEAANGADKLTNSVNGIGKKISLDQVISGIGSITGALETAASKAVQLGTQLWNSIMDSAAWSDDIGTLAERMGLTVEQVQQMKVVAAEFEVPVEELGKTWKKVRMNMTSDSADVAEAFNKVGVATRELVGDEGEGVYKYRDYLDVFWETGEALKNWGDEAERERLAQTLLGKSWDEMTTLFKKGRKAYEDAMGSVKTVDDETIENNGALADSVAALEEQFNIFKASVLGNISPELTKVTESFSGLLGAITEYANSPEGKELLGKIGEAVGSLIDDISNINPQEVVSGFVSVVTSLVDGLRWIVENKDTLITALEGVVIGWGALKLTGGALTIMKFINGLKDLGLLGGGSGAASGGGSAAAGGAGSAAASGASGVGVGAVAETALFAAPFALFYDGVKHDMELVSEWTKNAQNSIAEYQANVEKYSGSDMFNIWDVMTRYTTINGTPEDSAKMQDFAKHFFSWWNDEITDAGLDELAGAMSDEDFFSFKDAMEKILNGDTLYSSEEQQAFADAMNAAIKAAEGLMNPADVKLVADPNSATDLATQVGTVKVPAILVYSSPLKGYANGLPYVPNDGLYKLHRGEQVVPAREAGRSFSSNLYVENMNMSGGLSADALAASIAARNQRMMSGYGS